MTTGPGAGQTINGGFWASLDATTGAVLWEVAGANPPASPPLIPPPFPVTNPIATNQGPVSVANGVVFGGAMDAVGTMYAFSAATGDILWSYESGGSVLSGAAISDGSIYWGSGYSNFGLGTPNHKIYAFTTSGSAFGAPISPTVTAWTNGVLEAVNNPNPFEASTDIVFTIPKEDQVSLVIYNSSGIEVDRLINGPLAKGEHQVRWNSPQDLPAGTYLYRLTTSELTIVRQMVKVQ